MLTTSNHSAFHAKRVTVMGRDSSHIRDIMRIYDPASFLAIKPAAIEGRNRMPAQHGPRRPPGRPGGGRRYSLRTGKAPDVRDRLAKRASRSKK